MKLPKKETLLFWKFQKKSTPDPQKHPCNEFLRVEINLTEFFGVKYGSFSRNKILTLAHFKAREAGRKVFRHPLLYKPQQLLLPLLR